ncbi:MAG: MarR family transcriptional regulator [Dehalococcoidales bacterium]|nr:MarR family transcriptional regulator [Dehalococcoidales bacterium]
METKDIELLITVPGFTKALNTRLYRSKLSEVDLNITPRCFDIMKLLLEEGSMNISEVCKRLSMSKAQMTQLVAKLIKQRMIEKKLKEADKRNNILYLTALGEKTVQRHIDNFEKAAMEIMASLTKKDRLELIKALRKVQVILAKI